MDAAWKIWKMWIIGGLVALFAADLAVGYILWQSSREGVDAMRAQRDRLELQSKLLKADVARGERIRASLSGVGKEYDGFYHTAFLGSTDGYSAIDGDLGAIASKSSLRSTGIAFHEKEIAGRGVVEVDIAINGLERSKYFYLLSDLKLDSASTGPGIRLHLELHTYFRT
jgi:hypothetical protein